MALCYYQCHRPVSVLWGVSQIRLPAIYFLKSLKCQASPFVHTHSHHRNNLYLTECFFNAFISLVFPFRLFSLFALIKMFDV